ncbi:hypothetical protein, partial [Nocardia sp. NPDC003345]
AAVFGRLAGQRPEAAVRPIIALVDDPVPGRDAYRGGKRVPLVTGPDDRAESARLAEAVDDGLG